MALVTGWKLPAAERAALLRRFPPRWAEAVADHVTLWSRHYGEMPLPTARDGLIVGRADDGLGVEAMVVAIEGAIGRPDGSTYHITWSLEPGRRAVESNDVIRERGWEAFAEPVPVTLAPARFG